MALIAVVFGVAAMFGLRAWLDMQQGHDSLARQAATFRIVVASKPIAFGQKLNLKNLKEIPWPASSRPVGSYRSLDVLLGGDDKKVPTAAEGRFALASIVENEPVLASHITAPGQRPMLSSMLEPGHKAVAIRVNDVNGVAGFIFPGDHVDILMTRNPRQGKESSPFVVVLLQDIKVLAVDQQANHEKDKPTVAKSVTVDVTTDQAQILTLATDVGRLSLALRNAAGDSAAATRRVTLADLTPPGEAARPTSPSGPTIPVKPAPPPRATITVVRNGSPTSYDVLLSR